MTYDVISVGDSTVDYFFQVDDAHLHADIDHISQELCLRYGDKIAVDKLTRVPLAGNAANFAVGASRLDVKAALYTNIGDDVYGVSIRKHLQEEKVSTEFVVTNQGKETNFSTIINFRGERTILVYHTHWQYRLPKLPAARWVYLTSAAPTHLPLHQQLHDYLKANPETKLGFNPGTHQLNDGLRKLIPLMRQTELFIVNREEAAKLLGLRAGPIKKMLLELSRAGPKMVVITDGQHGSFATDGEAYYELEMFPGPRVEATGAGDSYSTGVILALLHGKEIEEALAWGSINAQSVVAEIGPQAGLLTLKEMEKRVKAHPHYRAHKSVIRDRVKFRA